MLYQMQAEILPHRAARRFIGFQKFCVSSGYFLD